MPTGELPSKIFTISDQDVYKRVARKAYELYQQRGEVPDHALDDLLMAERAVHAELLHSPLSDVPERAEAEYPGEADRA